MVPKARHKPLISLIHLIAVFVPVAALVIVFGGRLVSS
jgi:hypothetical protein